MNRVDVAAPARGTLREGPGRRRREGSRTRLLRRPSSDSAPLREPPEGDLDGSRLPGVVQLDPVPACIFIFRNTPGERGAVARSLSGVRGTRARSFLTLPRLGGDSVLAVVFRPPYMISLITRRPNARGGSSTSCFGRRRPRKVGRTNSARARARAANAVRLMRADVGAHRARCTISLITTRPKFMFAGAKFAPPRKTSGCVSRARARTTPGTRGQLVEGREDAYPSHGSISNDWIDRAASCEQRDHLRLSAPRRSVSDGRVLERKKFRSLGKSVKSPLI